MSQAVLWPNIHPKRNNEKHCPELKVNRETLPLTEVHRIQHQIEYGITVCDARGVERQFSDRPGTTRYAKITLFTVANGNWGSWESWGSCSVSCGGGERIRRRSCNNPAPENGGLDCQGAVEEIQTCNGGGCPQPVIPGEVCCQ